MESFRPALWSVGFVPIIEDGYRDLKILGVEKEITVMSSISIIEKNLPRNIKKRNGQKQSIRTPIPFM